MDNHKSIVDCIASELGDTDAQAAAALGGGIDRSNFSHWRKTGIPAKHFPALTSKIDWLTFEMLSGQADFPTDKLSPPTAAQ